MDSTEAYKVEPKTDAELTGLGGWLAVVGFSLIASIVQNSSGLLNYSNIYTPTAWLNITSRSSEFYIPGAAPLFLFWSAAIIILFFFGLYLLYLFFNKKRSFPKFFIAMLLTNLVLSTVFSVWDHLLSSGNEKFTGWTELLGACVPALIWTAYMRKSRRVKLTFNA